ncbi:MAG: DUF4282 domain-containing protein [Candidatus Poribacteria bacterium]|nr:DUF4282 domain-containing protein [Candidatus Poribacteria bacterium]
MKDFLTFKKMVAPIIIPILFWIGTIFSIYVGLVFIIEWSRFGPSGAEMLLVSFGYFFLGPILLRVFCELLLTLFSVNDKLEDIKGLLKSQQDNDNQDNSSNED